MKRYAIINVALSFSDGAYYCKPAAERAAQRLREEFGGTWSVVTLAEGFKPDGFQHLGEHGVRKRLQREASNAD